MSSGKEATPTTTADEVKTPTPPSAALTQPPPPHNSTDLSLDRFAAFCTSRGFTYKLSISVCVANTTVPVQIANLYRVVQEQRLRNNGLHPNNFQHKQWRAVSFHLFGTEVNKLMGGHAAEHAHRAYQVSHLEDFQKAEETGTSTEQAANAGSARGHPSDLVKTESPVEAPECVALQQPSIVNLLLMRGKIPGQHSSTPIPKGFDKEHIVGHRVKLWRPTESRWEAGKVMSYVPMQEKQYGVHYDNGAKEFVDLNQEEWLIAADDQKPLPPKIRTKALAAAAAEQREQTQQPAKQKGVAVRVEKPLQKKQGSKGGPGHKKKQQLPVSKGKGLQPHKHQQQGDSSSGDSIGASASDSASASSEDDEASSPKQQLIRHRSPSSNAVSKKQPAAAVKAGPASSSGVPVMQGPTFVKPSPASRSRLAPSAAFTGLPLLPPRVSLAQLPGLKPTPTASSQSGTKHAAATEEDGAASKKQRVAGPEAAAAEAQAAAMNVAAAVLHQQNSTAAQRANSSLHSPISVARAPRAEQPAVMNAPEQPAAIALNGVHAHSLSSALPASHMPQQPAAVSTAAERPVAAHASAKQLANGHAVAERPIVERGWHFKGDGFRVIRAQDGFEVLMLVPGYTLDEMDIRATDVSLEISATPSDLANASLWGVPPFHQRIDLPSPINPLGSQALLTVSGHLYLRVYDN